MDIEHHLAFVIGWNYQGLHDTILLSAYDTGSGQVRWEDSPPCPSGGICHGHKVVADKGRVFAVGFAAVFQGGTSVATSVVRAYRGKVG